MRRLKNRHIPLNVNAFSLTPTDVTVAQFDAFVDASGYVIDAEQNAGGNVGCNQRFDLLDSQFQLNTH